MFSAYELGSTYSRNLLTVPLGVLKVWGSPAPLPTPFPSSWTLQNPQCQRLIQLQHGLPVRQRTVLIQFHIQGARSFFAAWMETSFPKMRPSGLVSQPTWLVSSRKVGKIREARQCVQQFEAVVSVLPSSSWVLLPFNTEQWTQRTPATWFLSHSVFLCLSLASFHADRERSYGRCPLVTPANKSFIITPVAFSFFLLTPPRKCASRAWVCVCVCVLLSRSECLIITLFMTSKEWGEFTLQTGGLI